MWTLTPDTGLLAVRHSLPGGWFAFLRGIRLREDEKFDEEKTLAGAETADAKIAAASKEQHEADTRVEQMLTSAKRNHSWK